MTLSKFNTIFAVVLALATIACASIRVSVAPKPFVIGNVDIQIAEGQSFSVDLNSYISGATLPVTFSFDTAQPAAPAWVSLSGSVLAGSAPTGSQDTSFLVCIVAKDAKGKLAKSC